MCINLYLSIDLYIYIELTHPRLTPILRPEGLPPPWGNRKCFFTVGSLPSVDPKPPFSLILVSMALTLTPILCPSDPLLALHRRLLLDSVDRAALCIHICICIYIHIHICIYVYICIFIYRSIYIESEPVHDLPRFCGPRGSLPLGGTESISSELGVYLGLTRNPPSA